MWVLFITIASVAWGAGTGQVFFPTISTHDFDTKESCELAGEAYRQSMAKKVEEINATLNVHLMMGKLEGKNEVVVNVLCAKR